MLIAILAASRKPVRNSRAPTPAVGPRAADLLTHQRVPMATIEIRIDALVQLFDYLDPAPFFGRGLDQDVVDYIVSCAGDHPLHEPLRLFIHAPEAVRPHMDAATLAIHRHFALANARTERRNRHRSHMGRVALFLGMAVMTGSLAVRTMLGDWINTPIGQVIGEGLLILSWVVLWRPAELLLFERWENRQQHRQLARLARLPVEFVLLTDQRSPASSLSALYAPPKGK